MEKEVDQYQIHQSMMGISREDLKSGSLNSPWSITYYLLMFLDHILRANSWNCVKRYSDLSSRISEHCFQIWLVTCETFVFAGRAPVDFFSEGIDTDASRYTSIYVIIASLIFNVDMPQDCPTAFLRWLTGKLVYSPLLRALLHSTFSEDQAGFELRHSSRAELRWKPSKAASANKPTGRGEVCVDAEFRTYLQAGFIPGALISNILVSYSEIIHDFLELQIFLDFSIISFFGVWVWKNYIFSEVRDPFLLLLLLCCLLIFAMLAALCPDDAIPYDVHPHCAENKKT
eukprot:760659-Hanusia_phi.AAC.5